MMDDEFVANLLLRGFTKSASIAPRVAYHIFIKPKGIHRAGYYTRCISVYLNTANIEIVEAGISAYHTDEVDALKALDRRITEANGDRHD